MAKIKIINKDIPVLIDGDAIVYSVGFTIKPEKAKDTPLSHVYLLVHKMIEPIISICQSENISVYITSDDKSNYRFKVAKTEGPGGMGYKAQRAQKERPYHYNIIREHLVKEYNAEIVSGMEADDKLGIEATKAKDKGQSPIIATFDKDLHMVPVDIYDLRKKVLMRYTGDHLILKAIEGKNGAVQRKKLIGRGLDWFYAQMLLGDRIDNIPGCRGYGEVKTYNILKKCKTEKELHDETWNIYKKLKYTPDRFYEVATLLWMQTNKIKNIKEYLQENYDLF